MVWMDGRTKVEFYEEMKPTSLACVNGCNFEFKKIILPCEWNGGPKQTKTQGYIDGYVKENEKTSAIVITGNRPIIIDIKYLKYV